MFSNLHLPSQMPARALDIYLENGWFRMGQAIFTTQFLQFDSVLYPAIWLRVNLSDYEVDSTFIRLNKQNKNFEIEFNSATITLEKENLFQKYRNSLPFEPSSTLISLLLENNPERNIYSTIEICIRDNARLIACGYFDLGNESAMGIVSFFDPDYKKYSLGKFLIYSKINFCKDLGLQFFYPGYIAPGYKAFEYKKEIAKQYLEYFHLTQNVWYSIENLAENHLNELEDKTDLIVELLNNLDIVYDKVYYNYFDSNMIRNLINNELFDVPIFIAFSEIASIQFMPVLYYDLFQKQFVLSNLFSFASVPEFETKRWKFDCHLFKEREINYTCENLTELEEVLKQVFAS